MDTEAAGDGFTEASRNATGSVASSRESSITSGRLTTTKYPDDGEDDEFTLIKKLKLRNKKTNPYFEYDDRRHSIRRKWLRTKTETEKSIADEAVDKKDPIEKCLEENEEKLSELQKFGKELITNIIVTTQKRESMRRDFEEKNSAYLQRIVNGSHLQSRAEFDNITARFTELTAVNEPMLFLEQLNEVKNRINEEMVRKDDLIKRCQDEIDRVCHEFDEFETMLQDDLKAFAIRVDAQVDLTRKANNLQLKLLEETINEAQNNILLTEDLKFQDFYEAYEEGEQRKLDEIRKKEDYYRAELDRIARKESANTRSIFTRLETEHDNLLCEMRELRARLLINSELADYNCMISPMLEEEYFAIGNEQKHRIGRLRRIVNRDRAELKRVQDTNEEIIKSESEKAQKLHDSITNMEQKRRRLQQMNKKQFYDVWKINFFEVKQAIIGTIDADRVLTKIFLMQPYEEPVIDLYDYSPDDLAKEAKSKGLIESKCPRSNAITKPKRIHLSESENRANVRLMRNLLRLLADSTGFVMEARVKELIEPYTEGVQKVVRMANILEALRLRDMDCLKTFMDHFKRYAWCPNCLTGNVPKIVDCTLSEHGEDEKAAATSVKNDEKTSKQSNSRTSLTVKPVSSNQNIKTVCSDHYLVIEPAFVFNGINDYLKAQRAESELVNLRKSLKESDDQVNLIPISKDEILDYWNKFDGYIPKNMDRLWHLLRTGIDRFQDDLKLRAKLDEECAALRKQNQELSFFLQNNMETETETKPDS